MNKITKQCVAAVASLAMAGTLCVAGAVVAGSSAWAEDACNNGAPWSEACKTQTGSITITKYRDELKENSTTEQAKKTKLENAKFKVTKVKSLDNANLDLTKYDEWLKVAAKVTTLNTDPNTTTNIGFDNPVTNTSAPSSQTDKTLFVTNSDGVAKIDKLGIGLYKIEEVEAPKDHQKLSKPFFMTIPEVTRADNAKNNTYKYAVTVEPKDLYTGDAIHKYADTKNFIGVKDAVTYTIKSKVSSNSQTEVSKFTKDDLVDFAIWDDVPTNAFDAATSAVDKVTLSNNATNSFIKDGSNKDYEVETPVVGNGTGTGKNGIEVGYSRIKVKFTEAGLTKIATAYAKDPTITVNVTLKFTLKEGVTSGKIVNKFGMQGGHRTGENPPVPVNPNPNPESEVTVRDFQIKKVNGVEKTDNGVKKFEPLSGAKFAIFTTKEAADKCAKDADRTDTNCKVSDYAKGFVNAENGTGNNGLTTAFKAKVGEDFYIVETQAPKGFVLSPAVEKVKIQEQGDGWDSTKKIFTYTFKDLPNGGPDGGENWFKLPKTGAAGVIIFALIGLGLVGSGMFVFLKNRKKEEEQAA